MTTHKRPDGRAPDELRPVKIERNYLEHAEGSCMIEFGKTRVLCAASVEDRVAPWLRNSGKGWVTAEYSMLPRSTNERNQREASKGRPGGRTMEIQRLIGRSLRAAVNLSELGERTITIDCDCIVADGGTRTASITGGFIALYDALVWMQNQNMIEAIPLEDHIAAISIGVMDNTTCLDLSYVEDVRAEVDMNVVMNGNGDFVEVQGTAEGAVFKRGMLDEMLDYASKGIAELVALQHQVLDR